MSAAVVHLWFKWKVARPMTYDDLIAKMDDLDIALSNGFGKAETIIGSIKAVRAVIELHKSNENYAGNVCIHCFNLAYEPSGLHMDFENFAYPCWTIKTIAKELQ